MEINSMYGDVLFESTKETTKETLIQAVSEGAYLRGADLAYTDLTNVDLRGTDLRSADLTGSDLTGSDLRYTDLAYTDLTNVDLRSADLTGADLTGSNLRGANVRDASLPMSSKWVFSFKNDKLKIGCKTNTIEGWDEFFKSNEEFETPRNTQEFKQIEAMYLAHKNYYEFLNK